MTDPCLDALLSNFRRLVALRIEAAAAAPAPHLLAPLPLSLASPAAVAGSGVVIFSAATAAAIASSPGPNGEAVDPLAGREDLLACLCRVVAALALAASDGPPVAQLTVLTGVLAWYKAMVARELPAGQRGPTQVTAARARIRNLGCGDSLPLKTSGDLPVVPPTCPDRSARRAARLTRSRGVGVRPCPSASGRWCSASCSPRPRRARGGSPSCSRWRRARSWRASPSTRFCTTR